jgi:hypothetical protein
MASDEWVVRQRNANGEAEHGRVLHRGTEESARKFVADNFPRAHAEPGRDYGDEGPATDVVLFAPDGAQHTHHDGEWTDHSRTETDPVTVDEDDEPEVL